MADHRDTNHDGKVSLMEKVKDKLHMGGHSSTATTTHHTTSTTHHTGTAGAVGGYDSHDLNHDGHVSTGERLASGSHSHTAGSTHAGSTYAGSTHAHSGSALAGSTHAHGSHGYADSTEEARLRLHEEQLAISKREVGAGEVGIHKRVHEENVSQTVPVRREEVVVERRPLSGVADPHAHISDQDEHMRVALHREELVTEKRVVPTEEVIVRKKQVTENQHVGATLRSEHLETVQTNTHTSDAYGSTHGSNLSHGSNLAHGSNLSDARDTNHDGHVSTGEKLKGATHGR